MGVGSWWVDCWQPGLKGCPQKATPRANTTPWALHRAYLPGGDHRDEAVSQERTAALTGEGERKGLGERRHFFWDQR